MLMISLASIRFGVSVLLLLYIGKKICDIFYIFLIGPIINKVNLKSYGKWALVTGSSDGIGKAYAKQLAASGSNIVLVGHILEDLKNVAQEIETNFNVQTKVVHIDFSKDTRIYDKFAKEIEGLEIGILVNNVGIAYEYPEYFADLRKEFLERIIKVNVVSMIRVTNLILPQMVKRGKGIIVNLASSSYAIPFPLFSVYSATKTFVVKFSEGIEAEYRNKGILLQCLAPGPVKTNLSKFETTNLFTMTPDQYVKKAFRLLGTTTLTNGCFCHSLLILLHLTLINICERILVWLFIIYIENWGNLLKERNKK